MVKAIFWDNDGILVDTERLYFEATQRVLATVGVNLTEQLYHDLFLVKATGAWHLAAEKGCSPGEVERLRRVRYETYLGLLQTEAKAIDGVEEVLRLLRGKYVMGVVTSSHREHFDAAHKRTGLVGYFDFVLAAEDYSRYKPDPEPYTKAVAMTAYSKEECIAVEDSMRGLISARAAGLRCVVIPTELTRVAPFDGAYRVLRSIRELPSLLSQTP